MTSNGNNIKDDSNSPGALAYDPVSQQLVLVQAVSVTTDTVNGKNVKYGALQLSPLPASQNLIGYVEDIEQAGYIALTSPPAQTNAGSDTTLTFSQQVNRVIIQNNTSANAYYAFDTAASLGSLLLVPGAFLVYPKKVTSPHLYTVAAQPINGTSAGNIVVLGAL